MPCPERRASTSAGRSHSREAPRHQLSQTWTIAGRALPLPNTILNIGLHCSLPSTYTSRRARLKAAIYDSLSHFAGSRPPF